MAEQVLRYSFGCRFGQQHDLTHQQLCIQHCHETVPVQIGSIGTVFSKSAARVLGKEPYQQHQIAHCNRTVTVQITGEDVR